MTPPDNLSTLLESASGADPDLGRIERGHVCKHGVRWPHACQLCDDAAGEAAQIAARLTEPQRQAMKRQARGCYAHELGCAATGTINALHRRGLVDASDYLTPLGHAVRHALQSSASLRAREAGEGR